ncbi:MAG: radical SAM family heme chaperone HemW [Finegoldia sp.]|nr:radical SAM family heme chaperone HemW [Finegoldia sp.]
MIKGIYVHIPFCGKKCNYCDFSTMINQENRVEEYIDLLEKEIYKYKDKKDLIDTLYIGGGTPSQIDSKYIVQIYKIIERSFDLKLREFTIEANPDSIDDKKISDYLSIGVNRVSLGVQTFNNNLNKILGRSHCLSDVYKAYESISKKIDNISIDLMYGIPNQKIEDIEVDLQNIQKLKPKHISWYNLIVESGTKFYKLYADKEVMDEDYELELYRMIYKGLGEKYRHYEISNYAMEGFESKHNKIYWHDESYYGFGISASGYINKFRYSNEYFYNNYKKKILEGQRPLTEKEYIDREKEVFEYVIMNMRLKDGINLDYFYKKFAINFYHENKNLIEAWLDRNLIRFEKENLAFTDEGFYISNSFFRDLSLSN